MWRNHNWLNSRLLLLIIYIEFCLLLIHSRLQRTTLYTFQFSHVKICNDLNLHSLQQGSMESSYFLLLPLTTPKKRTKLIFYKRRIVGDVRKLFGLLNHEIRLLFSNCEKWKLTSYLGNLNHVTYRPWKQIRGLHLETGPNLPHYTGNDLMPLFFF